MRRMIALVFENRDTSKLIQYILEMQKYSVLVFSSENQLEFFLRSTKPDLYIVQGTCKNIESLGVVDKIKGSIVNENVPILVVDTLDENNIDTFLAKGVADYLIWPASPMQLETRVNGVLKAKMNQDQIDYVVEHKTHELLEVQSVMIESLATLAEYRDPETGGHIKRTQNYVKALAMELQKLPKHAATLTEKDIDLMYLSVPLHDIGKVGVRDDILLKPGKLTAEEYEEMKRHTTIGHETIMVTESKLKNNAFLKYADEVAYTHQEKWDGSGYPRGLKGEEIPLIGRMMAVADVYDALISKRVYKEAMTHEEAKRIIVDGRGSHFDPDMVDAFVSLEETFINISRLYADFAEIKHDYVSSDTVFNSRIKRILIADDSKLMLTIFANQLTNMGYKVTTVPDGQLAFDYFMAETFDLVITDLEMPVVDGFGLVQLIRSCGNTTKRSIPVIALTASKFDLTKEDIRQFGFDDYMLKPLDVELLRLKLMGSEERIEGNPPVAPKEVLTNYLPLPSAKALS